jgi:RNA recognition motif-containing protein
MSFTVFLGNLPTWVTADDIMSWLHAEDLIADSIKVIRNPETQESKGFAFIEAPNAEEMQSIIRRFNRAPLEDRILRANPAQPPRGRRDQVGPGQPSGSQTQPSAEGDRPSAGGSDATARFARRQQQMRTTPTSRTKREQRPPRQEAPKSAFAEELAKAL